MTCGGGSQTRMRTCSNPPPSGGGENCRGSSSESRSCNTQGCSGEKIRNNSFKSKQTQYTRLIPHLADYRQTRNLIGYTSAFKFSKDCSGSSQSNWFTKSHFFFVVKIGH